MAHWQAIKYMLFSVAAFTIMNASAKYLDGVSASQIVFFRSLGSFVLCMGFLWRKKIPLFGNQPKLLITRAVTGTIAMVFFFSAVKEIPFGSAVSLRYLSPVFAAVFAIILLKEYVSPLQWLCFLLALAGVLLLKGFDVRINPAGLFFILASALFSGLVYILIRKIGTGDHPVVVVNYFMFFAMLIGGLLSFSHWKTPHGSDLAIALSMGFFGWFGQVYMTKAYQLASVAVVAPLKYLEAVTALLVGWIWFGEGYTTVALIGIGLVIAGMMLTIWAPKEKTVKVKAH